MNNSSFLIFLAFCFPFCNAMFRIRGPQARQSAPHRSPPQVAAAAYKNAYGRIPRIPAHPLHHVLKELRTQEHIALLDTKERQWNGACWQAVVDVCNQEGCVFECKKHGLDSCLAQLQQNKAEELMVHDYWVESGNAADDLQKLIENNADDL